MLSPANLNLNRMRKHLFLLTYFIAILPASFVFPQGLLKLSNPMRVISYNIRYDNPGDGENSWDNRKERVVSVIALHRPEIFCLQEALVHQLLFIDEALPSFAYYGIGRDDGVEAGEFAPVFYDTNRFISEDQGTFWLSETPGKAGSKSWYAGHTRIVSWVKLVDRSLGLPFYVFNTHFDHASQHAREQSALLVKKKIRQIAGGHPVILAGDFNTREGSVTYTTLTAENDSPVLSNATDVSASPHHGPTCSFVGFDFINVPGRIIDFIFVNPQVVVIRHAILPDNWDGVYPSDHLPVLVDVELNQKSE